MAVEVIGRDVDQEPDRRRERGRKIDLVGRALDHVHAGVRGRRQIEDRHADVASERDVAPGFPEHMGDQCGRGRFAVGAGDGDEGRMGRPSGALTGEKFDVADDWNAGLVRAPDRPVRLGMGQRHAGREHERLEGAPVGLGEIRHQIAVSGGAGARRLAVVPGRDLGAAFHERVQGRQARAAEPEHGHTLAAEGLDRRHGHLSFNEARPSIASTKAMIQKRMTICASDQPSCSK